MWYTLSLIRRYEHYSCIKPRVLVYLIWCYRFSHVKIFQHFFVFLLKNTIFSWNLVSFQNILINSLYIIIIISNRIEFNKTPSLYSRICRNNRIPRWFQINQHIYIYIYYIYICYLEGKYTIFIYFNTIFIFTI